MQYKKEGVCLLLFLCGVLIPEVSHTGRLRW